MNGIKIRKKKKIAVMRSRSLENRKFGHFTLLFCEDGKEMYQNVKRTCRAIVFTHQAHCFVAFSLPLPSSLLKLPILFLPREIKTSPTSMQPCGCFFF